MIFSNCGDNKLDMVYKYMSEIDTGGERKKMHRKFFDAEGIARPSCAFYVRGGSLLLPKP